MLNLGLPVIEIQKTKKHYSIILDSKVQRQRANHNKKQKSSLYNTKVAKLCFIWDFK